MHNRQYRIVVSAGELSGDEHGAELIAALRTHLPAVELRGMGGENLQRAGVQLVVDSRRSGSVMGFAPVLRSLGNILASLKSMKNLLREWRPHALVLVDYPDFNFRLARYAHRLGIPVFYFIPPKMWAWRAGRVRAFRRYVDRAAVIFSFEKGFFASHGYSNAVFVGHPFVDTLKTTIWGGSQRAQFRARHGLSADRPLLCVLPGSRWFEIERHLAPALDAVRELQTRHPSLQAAIGVAPTIDYARLRELLPADVQISVITGGALDLMRASDAGLLKSGTSNLQAAFLRLPSMMYYLASPLSEWIVRNFVRIREYSLPNIIRSHTIKELTGSEVNTDALVEELERLLFDEQRRGEVLRGYDTIIESQSDFDRVPEFQDSTSSYDRAALFLIKLLEQSS